LFVDLLDSIDAFLEGAAKDETFIWLDIFTINQDVSPSVTSEYLVIDSVSDTTTDSRLPGYRREVLGDG
jgi:hypothetical protein